MDGRNIEFSKLHVGLLHAVEGVAWNGGVELVLDWFEVLRDVEGDVLLSGRSLNLLRISISLESVLAVAPGDYSVDVGWEDWLYSGISGLLADVHGDFAGRHFGEFAILGDGLRAAHQVDVGGVHVASSSMTAGVEEDALSSELVLDVQSLVDFQLVHSFFGDPADCLVDELWAESAVGAIGVLQLVGFGDGVLVGWGQQLQVVKRQVSSIL